MAFIYVFIRVMYYFIPTLFLGYLLYSWGLSIVPHMEVNNRTVKPLWALEI